MTNCMISSSQDLHLLAIMLISKIFKEKCKQVFLLLFSVGTFALKSIQEALSWVSMSRLNLRAGSQGLIDYYFTNTNVLFLKIY